MGRESVHHTIPNHTRFGHSSKISSTSTNGWFPSLTNSYGVHGNNGEPGCIRFCLGFFYGGDVATWARERVTAVDEVNMRLGYEIVESNLGFMNYESTIMINPLDDQDRDQGCVIEWVFRVDPVQGLRFEDLINKYKVTLQMMAKNMEDSIRNN